VGKAALVTAAQATSAVKLHAQGRWRMGQNIYMLNSSVTAGQPCAATVPVLHLAGKVVGQLPSGAGDGAQIQAAIVLPVPLSIRRCAAIPPSHPIGMRKQHSCDLAGT
jgi:hypothetical protein